MTSGIFGERVSGDPPGRESWERRIRGFRVAAPPATFGSSLPGLRTQALPAVAAGRWGRWRGTHLDRGSLLPLSSMQPCCEPDGIGIMRRDYPQSRVVPAETQDSGSSCGGGVSAVSSTVSSTIQVGQYVPPTNWDCKSQPRVTFSPSPRRRSATRVFRRGRIGRYRNEGGR